MEQNIKKENKILSTETKVGYSLSPVIVKLLITLILSGIFISLVVFILIATYVMGDHLF